MGHVLKSIGCVKVRCNVKGGWHSDMYDYTFAEDEEVDLMDAGTDAKLKCESYAIAYNLTHDKNCDIAARIIDTDFTLIECSPPQVEIE